MSASNTSSDRPDRSEHRSSRVRRYLAGCALTLIGASAVACGLSPGDYVVYRIAGSSVSRSLGCYYPATEVPANAVDDIDTVLDSVTLAIHIGSDGNAYLSGGGVAFQGEESDDGYTFNSEIINVEYVGPEDDARIAATTTTTVDLIVSGDAVEGTVTTVTTVTCDYVTATPSDTTLCPAPAVPTCNEVSTFVGVEIDDVELTTGVD